MVPAGETVPGALSMCPSVTWAANQWAARPAEVVGSVVGGVAVAQPTGPTRVAPNSAPVRVSAVRPRRMDGCGLTFGFLSWDRSPGTSRQRDVLRLCPVVHDGALKPSAPQALRLVVAPAGAGMQRPTVAGQRRDSTGFPRGADTRLRPQQST